jgi:glycosyltransferase involved in cell wall biosynthesis
MVVIYLGFNDPLVYARGVENVIKCQSRTLTKAYYIYFDETKNKSVARWGNLITIPVKKTYFWPLSLNFILVKLYLRNQKSIFIHSHNYLMSFFGVFASDLLTVHDALSYQYRMLGRTSLVFSIIEKVVYKKCKKLHFVSNFAKEKAMHTGVDLPAYVIHNSSVREFYSFKDNKRSKDNFGEKYILVVRSLEYRVGWDVFLDAAQKVGITNSNIRFLIAGKGPLEKKITRDISILGLKNVTLLGYVGDDDLCVLYKNCEFTVTPALHGEGFGLPIIESYYFNKVALASGVCAVPEVIADKRYLFENTAESMSEKIIDVWCHPSVYYFDAYGHYQKKFGLTRYLQHFRLIYPNAALR